LISFDLMFQTPQQPGKITCWINELSQKLALDKCVSCLIKFKDESFQFDCFQGTKSQGPASLASSSAW
jgi:hypothetical protein